MPIYEYHCKKCNKNFEEWLKVSEAEKDQQCPDCGTLSSRFVSQTSFVLKGGGWYVSEYGKNSASSTKQSGVNTAESSSSQSSDSSDTKKADSVSNKAQGNSNSTHSNEKMLEKASSSSTKSSSEHASN